jgi:hypothetical protein
VTEIRLRHVVLTLTRSKDHVDAFVCRSDLGIAAESVDEAKAVNFAKGATLALLGELWAEIPDEVKITFAVDRAALEGPIQAPPCDAGTDCKNRPALECECVRCRREPDAAERWHACAEHMQKAGATHLSVRQREAIWRPL